MHYPTNTVYTRIATDQGPVWLAATAQGLAGLWFDGQKHFPPALLGSTAWAPAPQHPTLLQAAAQLHQYLQGQRRVFDLPLDLSELLSSAPQASDWDGLTRRQITHAIFREALLVKAWSAGLSLVPQSFQSRWLSMELHLPVVVKISSVQLQMIQSARSQLFFQPGS